MISPFLKSVLVPFSLGAILFSPPAPADPLSLQQAINLAQRYDPWLQGSLHDQRSMEDMSVASGALPDPKVSLAFANLPTNTWDFDQEPMTQFKVGVSQMFPRGDQRGLQQKKMQLMSQRMPFERAERLAQIRLQVSTMWLDAWQAQQSVELIKRNYYLFEQMSEITQSSYASAMGHTRQQDVIRAQLELTRLEDRLVSLEQQRDSNFAALGQWIAQFEGGPTSEEDALIVQRPVTSLPTDDPELAVIAPAWLLQEQKSDWQQLSQIFMAHPSVRMLEQKIYVSRTEVDLAQQKYSPEWGVNASYGYRDDDPVGSERADFFSVGVTLDVPLFTANRQDREVSAAVSKVESVKTEKWLRLKSMLSGFESMRAQWQRLNQRHELYRTTLLPQAHEQAEASLTAYTNESGGFSEVMRARIAELNAQIDALNIFVQQKKVTAHLNYYFASADHAQQGGYHHE